MLVVKRKTEPESSRASWMVVALLRRAARGPKEGAHAAAVALGRIVGRHGLNLEAFVRVARRAAWEARTARGGIH